MKVEDFVRIIGSDFYTGVPDSQLRALCDYLYDTYKIDGRHHIIAANEGNAVGIAAGYNLATGKIPVVYMQNSGEGNVINPLASLLNEKVYAIPCLFVIGWRGEPGVHDEPQHIYQGEVTTKLLDVMGVEWEIVTPETTEDELNSIMERYKSLFEDGHSAALVIRKNALAYGYKVEYSNSYSISREEAIRHIVEVSGDDPIICTTGKASRELFEIREEKGQGHDRDFLTVGSMGHASSIALGIALNTDRRVWCIDGDGALIMHMGAMATIGRLKPTSFIHIALNNGAHETVGGMPTCMSNISLCSMAKQLGYERVYKEVDLSGLDTCLTDILEYPVLSFADVRCKLGARDNLGRPTLSPIENKLAFMETIRCY